jgi:hypothetical protein
MDMKSRFLDLCVALALLVSLPGAWPQSNGIDPALLAKAKAGDADAEFRVAVSYANLGNLKESHRWHLMAAQNGNARAMTIVAAEYEFGRNVARDDKQAFSWYRKAASAGDLTAITNVGDLYERGVGVQQDFAQAAAWYLKAAEQGDQYAQLNLGLLYENGQGVAQDYAKAAIWWRQAAEHGNAAAQYNLGRAYNIGQGVAKDYTQAALLFRKAADQGNVDGQYMLGLLYALGIGVPQSYAEAVMWYRKAADQGDANAENDLGELYFNGGVMKPDDTSKGNNRMVRDDGGGPFPKDFATAAMWLQKAAEQGNADAQNDLGLLYEDGNGVPQNYAEAYFWFSLASAKTPYYSVNRDRIASNLTKTTLLQTQERAQKWFEDHPAKANPQ